MNTYDLIVNGCTMNAMDMTAEEAKEQNAWRRSQKLTGSWRIRRGY